MSFDPEKVEHVTANANFTENGVRRYYDHDVVQAEDYDALLALYREATCEIERLRYAMLDMIEFANGEGDVGNIVSARLREAFAKQTKLRHDATQVLQGVKSLHEPAQES